MILRIALLLVAGVFSAQPYFFPSGSVLRAAKEAIGKSAHGNQSNVLVGSTFVQGLLPIAGLTAGGRIALKIKDF